VRKVVKNRLRIGPIEAIDGTPVIDIKPCFPATQTSYRVSFTNPRSTHAQDSSNWTAPCA
jgi:tRNA (Thr-GGU) A37 N-methylase